MSKIDEHFTEELKKEEESGVSVLGRLRKIEEGKTEICFKDLIEIRDKNYKFPDKVTRELKLIERKIYIFRDVKVHGVPLIVPISVHRDIRELRLKHGQKMVKVIIRAKGEGILRRYKVVPEVEYDG